MAPIYQASNGNIVIEAEDNTDGNTNRGSTSWSTSTGQSGYVGSSALLSSGSYTTSTGWISNSAERRYEVWFDTPGTYYVYLRMYATSGGANSASIGLDGNEAAEAYNIQTTTYNSWVWATSNNASQPATITVSTVGLHMLRLYVREAAVRIDRIGLTLTSGGAVFSGNGPAATARSTPPAGGAWSSITATRQFVDRTRKITIATTAAAEGYLTVPLADGSTNYYAAPLASDGVTLTLAASQSAAASSPAPLPTNGVWRLPALIEARQFTITHRSPAATSYGVSEYYPRRHVEADDIDVENLRAVSAYTGNLFVDGVLSIAAAGGLYGGTGTFSAPATGLKWDIDAVSGIGRLRSFRDGTEQVAFDTNGRLTWASGQAKLDAQGAVIYANEAGNPAVIDSPVGVPIERSYAFRENPTNDWVMGLLTAYGRSTTGYNVYLGSGGGTIPANYQSVMIEATCEGTSAVSRVYQQARGAGGVAQTLLESRPNSTSYKVSVGAVYLEPTSATYVRRPLVLYNPGGTNITDTYQLTTSLPTPSTRLLTVSGGPQQWHGATNTTHTMLLTAPSSGMVFGTENTAALYLGGPVALGAVSATAAIECSWGGTNNLPQVAIGVVRDGVRANVLMDFTGTTTIRNGSTTLASFAGSGLITLGNSLQVNGNAMGFYGTSPQGKQTVTGSRGGNAALASLLTALATAGIITNSTSA